MSSDGRGALGVVWRVLRKDPKLARALVAYLVFTTLAVVGVRAGERHNPWLYLLTVPLVVLSVAAIPSSLRDAQAKRIERKRVRHVAAERGSSRHSREKSG